MIMLDICSFEYNQLTGATYILNYGSNKFFANKKTFPNCRGNKLVGCKSVLPAA